MTALRDALVDAWDAWDERPTDRRTAETFHTAVTTWARHHGLDAVRTRHLMAEARRGNPIPSGTGRSAVDLHRTWLRDQPDRSRILNDIAAGHLEEAA